METFLLRYKLALQKEQQVLKQIPHSFIQDEILPNNIRVKFAAPSNTGNCSIKG